METYYVSILHSDKVVQVSTDAPEYGDHSLYYITGNKGDALEDAKETANKWGYQLWADSI